MAANPGERGLKAVSRLAGLPAGFLILLLLSSTLAAAGQESVYEGRDAGEWGKELKAGNNVAGAQHALAVLGKDAVPTLMELLRDPDRKVSASALAVLKDVKLDIDGVAAVLPLLKDESFQVRRAAVKLLARYVPSDPAVAASVKAALQDKDKAVVEAAEEVLGAKAKTDEDAKLRRRFDKFLADARAAAGNGNVDEAKVNLDLAKSLGLEDAEARERINVTALALAEAKEKGPAKLKGGEEKPPPKIKDAELQRTKDESNRKQQLNVLLKNARLEAQKGDVDNARRILREASKLFPDDERPAALLKAIEAKRQGGENEDGAAPEKELNKKPTGAAPGKEPKWKPAAAEGKGKDIGSKPELLEAPGVF